MKRPSKSQLEGMLAAIDLALVGIVKLEEKEKKHAKK